VQCGNDICCSSDQFCCGTQPGGYCCDNGSICVKGQLEIWLYSYCCSAGSDPAGCQTDVGGRQLVAYCRQADQTCCGPFGPCNRGQYCADATFCICCPAGQSFCGGNCCDGTCLTYNKGTSAENRVCCPKPTVGPICCAPTIARRLLQAGKFVAPTRRCAANCAANPRRPATIANVASIHVETPFVGSLTAAMAFAAVSTRRALTAYVRMPHALPAKCHAP
jgi:hypothetical protein